MAVLSSPEEKDVRKEIAVLSNDSTVSLTLTCWRHSFRQKELSPSVQPLVSLVSNGHSAEGTAFLLVPHLHRYAKDWEKLLSEKP